ncbi:MAG: PilZ domain-containing protein [Candidatus Omnitrophica bacterium]|nr:PilZ domain-containing protein [Candidatus Omnitrophota bacterium]
MFRLAALWSVFVAAVILLLVLREERLAAEGRVPLGRLRRFWFRRERRRFPRYRVDWAVRYERAGSEEKPSLPAQARDLSQGGAGLLVQERLEVGTQITVSFPLPGGGEPLILRGRVVRVKELPAGTGTPSGQRSFFVGIQFEGLDLKVAEQVGKALGHDGSH